MIFRQSVSDQIQFVKREDLPLDGVVYGRQDHIVPGIRQQTGIILQALENTFDDAADFLNRLIADQKRLFVREWHNFSMRFQAYLFLFQEASAIDQKSHIVFAMRLRNFIQIDDLWKSLPHIRQKIQPVAFFLFPGLVAAFPFPGRFPAVQGIGVRKRNLFAVIQDLTIIFNKGADIIVEGNFLFFLTKLFLSCFHRFPESGIDLGFIGERLFFRRAAFADSVMTFALDPETVVKLLTAVIDRHILIRSVA